MIRGVGAALCGRPLREPTKGLPYVTSIKTAKKGKK
jgi:hypothetical protein